MTKDVISLSRRRLLQGGSAIMAAGLASAPAFAKGPMLGTQAPYFYRFKLGNAEATVVSDGSCRSAIRPRRSSGSPRRRSRASFPATSCRWRTPCSSRTR